MKRFLLTTSVALCVAVPGFAAGSGSMFRTDTGPAEIRMSEFIGKRIYQSEDEILRDAMDGVQDGWRDIGEVHDVLLSRDGRAEAVLIDIGGFLGIGENQVAVNMDSLDFVNDEAGTDGKPRYFLVLNAPVQALEDAPVYETAAKLENGMGDAKAETAPVDPGTEAPVQAAEAEGQAMSGETTSPGGFSTLTGEADPSTRVQVPQEELTAGALTGANVYDAAETWVGEVSDLVLDADGQITAVIVDVGGFLGAGEKPVALSLGEIDIVQDETGLRVSANFSKEDFESMPPHGAD